MDDLNNKVLVMGSTGMLGHKVVQYLLEHSKFNIIDLSHRKKLRKSSILIDAMNKSELVEAINDLKPNYIVNCIGDLVSTKVDYERAIYLNAYLPHLLKKVAASLNSKLIHISTDCVFSGKKGSYLEGDYKDGKGLYAETKKMGEISSKNHLTIRSSIIGPELKAQGRGLFQWFVTQNEPIDGYTKSVWSGVSTLELSKAIKWSIVNDISGLYHITNGIPINKNEILNLINNNLNSKKIILPVMGKSQNKSFIDSRKLINYKIPSYENMINTMVEDVKFNISKYKHYKL